MLIILSTHYCVNTDLLKLRCFGSCLGFLINNNQEGLAGR